MVITLEINKMNYTEKIPDQIQPPSLLFQSFARSTIKLQTASKINVPRAKSDMSSVTKARTKSVLGHDKAWSVVVPGITSKEREAILGLTQKKKHEREAEPLTLNADQRGKYQSHYKPGATPFGRKTSITYIFEKW
jgi:hypothetical protein